MTSPKTQQLQFIQVSQFLYEFTKLVSVKDGVYCFRYQNVGSQCPCSTKSFAILTFAAPFCTVDSTTHHPFIRVYHLLFRHIIVILVRLLLHILILNQTMSLLAHWYEFKVYDVVVNFLFMHFCISSLS